jgi:RNA polymerase sigma-70 factor (ECF subfamily)
MNQTPDQRDVGSLAAQLEGHRSWLQAVLVARTSGNAAAAEDLVSGMFADLLACPSRCAGVASLPAWLYRIAVNRATDWQREEGRQRLARIALADDQPEPQGSCGAGDSPLDLLIDGERAAAFARALESLQDADRDLLQMKFQQGLSYQQIAARLACAPGQVANRLRTSKARLKAALLDSPHAEEFRSLEKANP